MAHTITAKQFFELVAWKRISPFRELRADHRAAMIVTTLANINRGKGQKAYTIDQFMPKWEEAAEPKRKQTWQEQKRIFELLALAHSVNPDKPEPKN